MKRVWYYGLVWACMLCVLLAACTASVSEGDSALADETAQAQDAALVTAPDVTLPKISLEDGTPGNTIELGENGRIKLTYSGNRSSVKYISSVDALPDYEELERFDAEFFQNHALLLVVETVSSGTIEVGIASVTVEDGVGSVKLSHEAKGDMDTADMTTWLIWVVVEQGIECRWTVENPALESDVSAY